MLNLPSLNKVVVAYNSSCKVQILAHIANGEAGCLKLGFDSPVAAMPCTKIEQSVLRYRITANR